MNTDILNIWDLSPFSLGVWGWREIKFIWKGGEDGVGGNREKSEKGNENKRISYFRINVPEMQKSV